MTKAPIHSAHFQDIVVGKDRQRKEFEGASLMDLATSIIKWGLFHPVTVRREEETEKLVLIAGERRIRAMNLLWNLGETVRCGGVTFDTEHVPFVFVGEVDPLDAFEMELEENLKRVDLPWQEKAAATAKLFKARKERAARTGEQVPTLEEFTKDVSATRIIDAPRDVLRSDVILTENMHRPEVAAAATPKEALKVLRRLEAKDNAERLAASVGESFTRSSHTLLQGNCLEVLQGLPALSFDVCCSDPPYGMDAHTFDDSGGKVPVGAHGYEDSLESWFPLMEGLFKELSRVMKAQAALYLFCDFDRFIDLRNLAGVYEWKAFRTPLVWVNQSSNRVPWPDMGPMRKYQLVLYCQRGDRKCNQIYPDVLVYPSDANLGHNAQKPVAAYVDLLRRSVLPGDSVLDPFCGSGPLFPAAHELKCKATGIELDPAFAGIAASRIEGLK